jgi:Ca2+-binding EF-hand superfamily protein
MSSLLLLCCTAQLTGCIAAVRSVAHKRPDPAKFLDAADANRDGVVTRVEFDAAVVKRFASLDLNGDGVVDQADLPKRLRNRLGDDDRTSIVVKKFDTDGDGHISRTEFATRIGRVFELADRDQNGELSAAELAAAKAAMRDYFSKPK